MTANRLRNVLAIQTRREVAAGLANDALIERVVADLHKRMNQQGFKGDKPPLPFLRGDHNEANGEYVRELRCCLGISQAKMSRLVKVGADVISRVERNLDRLNPPAAARVLAVGMKYADDGRRPEIPDEAYAGGAGASLITKLQKHRVPVREAVQDPKFAIKEVGIGFLAGLAGVGALLMLAGAGLVLLAGALTR